MKRVGSLIVLSCFIPAAAFSQADACRGAASALDRVKKQITPELGTDPLDSSAREQLENIYSTLETSSKVCNSLGEIFYYRALVAERLQKPGEVRFARGKQRELHFEPAYNPFLPSAAQKADSITPLGPVRQKWAIVVGVSSFKNPNSFPTLKYAKSDADDFDSYLVDPKGGRFERSRVRTLTDDMATTSAFWDLFSWVRNKSEPDDLVVIYISSHGTEPVHDKANKVSFIALHDTVDKPEQLFSSSVEMVDLVERLNREVRARRLVLFLDTCYSGDASAAGRHPTSGSASKASTDPFGGSLAKLNVAKGRAVITASSLDEPSWEDDRFKSGYFSHFLIGCLRQENQLPLGELFPKIRDNVIESVKHDLPGITQTPSGQFDNQSEKMILSVPETR